MIMAKFIDTTKMSEEELDRQIMADLGLQAPSLPEEKEYSGFELGGDPNMDSYCTWIQNDGKYGFNAHLCRLDYLERNLKKLEKDGKEYKVYLQDVTKKEAYDWKARVQEQLMNKFMLERDKTDRERGTMWKEIKNKRG